MYLAESESTRMAGVGFLFSLRRRRDILVVVKTEILGCQYCCHFDDPPPEKLNGVYSATQLWEIGIVIQYEIIKTEKNHNEK